jgi:hypothetical protein
MEIIKIRFCIVRYNRLYKGIDSCENEECTTRVRMKSAYNDRQVFFLWHLTKRQMEGSRRCRYDDAHLSRFPKL